RIEFVGPNSLEIRFTPGRFQRDPCPTLPGLRGRVRCLSRTPSDRHRNGGADSGHGNGDSYDRARDAVAHDDLPLPRSVTAAKFLRRISTPPVGLGSIIAYPCGLNI